MNRSQTKAQIRQLKYQLRAANRATNARLLKLAVVMALLAAIAALLYGPITL
jgi:hypothetical protein